MEYIFYDVVAAIEALATAYYARSLIFINMCVVIQPCIKCTAPKH